MKRSFPFALEILHKAGGARRQGSATSALARGLDCGRHRPSDPMSRTKGKNKGPASAMMPQLGERPIHKIPDTTIDCLVRR